jgi:hypothetical protein
MKRIFITLLLALISTVMISASSVIALQSNDQQSASQPTPAPGYALATLRRDFKNSIPLSAGEKLEYEVKFSRFPIYATVGIVTFEYLGPVSIKRTGEAASTGHTNGVPAEPLIKGLNVEFDPTPDTELLHLRATAVSKGVLIAILGIDVKNRYGTLVDANDFSARVSFQELKEGKKHSVESSVFDRTTQQVKYLTTNLANPQEPPKAKFLPLQDGMMSLLSALYFVRLQKYKEGQILRFPVSADGKNYQFDIFVGKREKIKSDCGTIKTIKLEPKLFGKDQFFSKEGEMAIWVTDDKKHLPVQLAAKTPSGTIKAKLINFKNNCKIEDSETEEKENDVKK